MAQCNRCGQAIPDGSPFCNSCGSPVSGSAPGGPPPDIPKKSKSGLVIGLIIGAVVVGVVVVIIGLITIIAVPSLLEAKNRARQRVAMAMLRNITSAEMTYSYDSKNNGYYGSLADLCAQGFLDNRFQSGQAHFDGYTFTGEATTANFTFRAIPDDKGKAEFYIDDTAVIRYANGEPSL